jgi:WD40 repeat protein
VVQERQLGKSDQFDRLTGSRQLWWRCCRDAVRARSAWLRQSQADQALKCIRVAVAFSPYGKTLATGDSNHHTYLWDLDSLPA